MELSRAAVASFRAMREGVLIIDAEARILFANPSYLRFIGKKEEELVGRPLKEVRPGARLPEVLITGQPILHAARQETEEIYFVNMYPIYDEGRLVGGLSVVTFVNDAFDFREKMAAYEKHRKQVLRRINKANSARYTFDSIVATSENSLAVKTLAQRAAETGATVLLASESGTGKELYAQAIHNGSSRKNEVFVAINCANFNANTLESELFGYVEGAFTGAKKGGKIGLFEAANGGTLFLDEISEMDMNLQSKLLRAIQEGRIRPVGAVDEVEVDVRIIAASNADLSAYIEQGKFRRDLYYRLSTFCIHIPPLRERAEEIPVLAREILSGLSLRLKRPASITPEALNCLMVHDWPGNIRELRNVLEASVYLSEGGVITPSSLPDHIVLPRPSADIPLAQRVRLFEQAEIKKLLAQNGSSLAGKKKTAAQLGISLATLYNKMAEF